MSKSCYWCGRSDGDLKTITVETPTRLGTSTKEETVTVHPKHESDLRDFNKKARTHGKRFLILAMLFGAVLPVGAALLLPLVSEGLAMSIIGGSTVALSAVLYLYPFATPETVSMIGVEKSVRLVRVLSIVVAALGFWILWMGLL